MAKKEKLLTIGMPCFDDYDGVCFSVQSLRMHHSEVMDQVEILVVDNNPDSKHGKTCKKLVGNNVPNGRYIPFDGVKGPFGAKDLVFREANTPFVMCMDAHVLLPPRALTRLLHYYLQRPKTNDLVQGPLMYDGLNTFATHFHPRWRGEMYGIWACDNRGMEIHQPPFEIPMQGMGLFSARKEIWELLGGFNPMMRGFGGEEGYIHEKFRRYGFKCWCLPFLRWWHRFDRPGGVTYPLNWRDKVRNYYIGWLELGMDVEPIIKHFTKPDRPRAVLEQLLKSVKHEVVMQQLTKTGRLPGVAHAVG